MTVGVFKAGQWKYDGKILSPVAQRETHTYAIEGAVTTAKVFVPFPVSKSSVETLSLVGVHRRASGGSGTFTVQRGGVALTGFTGLAVSTALLTTTPTAILLADADEISMVLASGSLTGWASFTLLFDRVSPVAAT